MSRLDHITDWEKAARKAGYRVDKLAAGGRVTRQQLNRYFKLHFGITAHTWLQREKLKTAVLMLQLGRSVKEVAGELGYQNSTHFSRAFRRVSGESPTRTAPAIPPRML